LKHLPQVTLAQETEDEKFRSELFEKLETMKNLMENIEKLKNFNVKLTARSSPDGAKSWAEIAKSIERKIVQALREKSRC
jgi:hypothetical protein